MPVHPWTLFFLIIFSSIVSFSSAVNYQGEALLSWRRSLNGSVEALGNWDPTDETPCGWFGIFCNSNGEVEQLNLRDVDLFGNVPSDFSALMSMNKLVLSGTNLTGPIPKGIGDLQRLVYLDLSENGLTGEIPVEICRLPELEEIYLNSNRLEGSIPAEIGNLTSLVRLTLYDNHLAGGIPSSIGGLKKLEVIRAGGNKNLEGPLPGEIGNCTNLVMLGLAETSISGFLPPSLGQLKRLQTIAIYTALLSGQIPPELGDCTSLENIYLYENSLTGSIPARLGNIKNLQNLLLWQNNLVGTIPSELGNCRELLVIDISLNSLTGIIPETVGNLSSLQDLQLSVNQISGTIPPSISSCRNLEVVDLSENGLTGPIPAGLFKLQKLNKLLLLSNNLSGTIPPEIGKCSSLIRFRASENKLAGSIPPQIGFLKNLNFLDLGENRITGVIPSDISGCRNLSFLDLHSNSISGNLPENLNQLGSLQLLDVSDNLIEGALSTSLGSLISLSKLVLAGNRFSGPIPTQLGSCWKLQLLDLSSNQLSGQIPGSLGKIPALEIALNLSWNQLSGVIPAEFTALDKLGVLDLSHNRLSGDLKFLADLQNLIVLNISHNKFSGDVPNTPFFSKLSLNVLFENPDLCFSGNSCTAEKGSAARRNKAARVVMVVLLFAVCVLLLAAFYIINGSWIRDQRAHDGEDDVEMGPPWEVTLYQKLDLSIVDIAKALTAGNIIGRGRTGIVYRAILPSGLTIAIKRFRLSDKDSASAFSSEIATLSKIRHRNIVRLLGWGANQKTKLLFYDYLPNATLGALLHESCGGGGEAPVEWETRFKIALGVAEGLAYLHHDYAPPILHCDVKTHNILLGDQYEPRLADFGLARMVEDENSSFSANLQFAGSYGYMAPEYACMLKITEKSDVFSFGVVLLEIITGKKPVDPSFPDEQHLIQWVRTHLKNKKDPIDVIDLKLQGHPDTHIQEMLQALGISLLCTSYRAEDRPTMKDVVALLREIRHDTITTTGGEIHKPTTKALAKPDGPSYSSSSMTPAQLMMMQGSSNCSLAYSSSGNYSSGNQ